MTMRLPVALLLLAAACGDDGDPNSCQPAGVADVTGSVQGEALGPFVRAAEVETGAATGPSHAIVLDPVDGACGELAPTGTHLVLLFCAPPVAGELAVASTQAFHCPTSDVLALVERDGGVDVATATSGMVTIDGAAGCVRGTYSLQFGVDLVEGMFDAVVCQ